MTTVTADNNNDEQPQQTYFHLELHAWMDAQQTAHGVRHDDYAQYHAYCTRRLKRLSHHPEAKKYLICSSKYATTTTTTTTGSGAAGDANKSSTKKKGSSKHAYASRLNDTFATSTTSSEKDTEKEEELDEESSATIANGIPHENILWYLLVLSERAWAHGNQLRKQKKRKQQVLKRFQKAKYWSQLLLTKVQQANNSSSSGSVVSESTVQECQAYASWMSANYALEKLDYQTASQEFAKAMTLCHQLGQAAVEEEEETTTKDGSTNTAGGGGGRGVVDHAKQLERQDLFLTRADTLLRPLFRYCQYELKQAGQETMEEPILVNSNKQQQHQQAAIEEETVVHFRGMDLVPESKELRVLLLKLQSMEQQHQQQVSMESTTTTNNNTEPNNNNNNTMDKMDETSFLNELSVLDDALEVVQASLTTLEQAQVVGPAVQAKKQQYYLWKGYLQWQKTLRVMEHTQALLDNITTTGHAERVHVYDALLQHAHSLLTLPGSSSVSGGGNVNDPKNNLQLEEDEFALQVQANILRLRALKTFHMAWYYYKYHHQKQSSRTNKYSTAWALALQSEALSKRAQEEIAACDEDMPHADEYLKELEELPMAGLKAAIQAAWYLQHGGTGGKRNNALAKEQPIQTTTRPLWLRLPDNDAGMVLADGGGADNEQQPQQLLPMPIPCKPVFYDLAFDYAIDGSSSIEAIRDYVEEHTVIPDHVEEEETKSSGGFFGWLTGK